MRKFGEAIKLGESRSLSFDRVSAQGIAMDVAMKASGHSSVQMHKRYIDLQAADVANAFNTAQINKRNRAGATK
jgi:hypothetical protein